MHYISNALPLTLPIGWEGAGWVGSHKVVGKVYVFNKNREMTAICAISLPMSHKAAKSTAKLISQSFGDSQPAVCLPREDGAI